MRTRVATPARALEERDTLSGMRYRYRLDDLLCGFLELLAKFLDILPRFVARPLGWIIAYLYLGWDVLFFLLLPTFLVGKLGTALLMDYPLRQSLPTVLLLAFLLAIVWRQWSHAETLRERADALKRRLRQLDADD